MSDEGTRSSSGGLGPEQTTVGSRRIQVRMQSGKIYGPYQRFEVLNFIETKRVKGEEWILYEGTTEWKAIASDPEFFDAIQAAQFGVTKERSAPFEEATRRKGFSESSPMRGGASPKVPATHAKARLARGEVEIKVPGMEALPLEDLPKPAPGGESGAAPAFPAPAEAKAPKASNRPKPLIVVLAIAALAIGYVLSTRENHSGSEGKGVGLGVQLQSPLVYARPLRQALEDLNLTVPLMPEKVLPSELWEFPETSGAHRWAEDLVSLASDAKIDLRSTAAYWGRWVWDLLWLGATVSAFDESAGDRFTGEGRRILRVLRDRKLVPPAMDLLYEAIPLFCDGKWDEVVTKLSPLKDLDIAQALAEEAAWWSFWEKGATGGKILVLKEGYASPDLDVAAKIRVSLANRDRDLPDHAEQLALRDPKSVTLWFGAAEFYWRLAMDQVQRANGRFVMGLAVLSLYPRSVQAVYWKQYTEFLTAFGRQTTAELANGNYEVVRDAKLKDPKRWWDLNQENLDIARIVAEILARSSQGPLFETDVAGLQALGPVVANGDEALVAAGQHLALEEEWSRSESLFRAATKVNPRNLAALGGLVWTYASQYRFEKAFEVYDRLSKLPSEIPESLKYHALIEIYGREYEEALQSLTQYAKSAPTDPWGHYFTALLWLKQEKNVNCAKSASLARLQSNGEIRFRSNLLYWQCRILAKVGVSEALAELKALYQKNPRNIPVVSTLTQAFLALNLTSEAQQVAEDTLRKFPRSYRLRILLGEVYESKQDYDKAVAFYSSAMKERADSAEAGLRIAKVYELQDKPIDAARNYFTAGQMNPDYPEIWLLAARAYAAAGRKQEASDLYIKEIEQRPAVMSSFVEAAEFMLANGAPQRVAEIFRKYQANFEDDPRVMTRLAQAYLVMKDFENARSAASTAIRQDPKVAEPYRILGVIFEQQGLYEQAKQNYDRFMILNPGAPEADQLRRKMAMPPFSH